MNILILSWRATGHPNAGGAEIVTMEHAKAWVRSGHIVSIFTSGFEGGKKSEVVDGVRVIREGSQAFGVKFRAMIFYLFGKHERFDLVVDEFHGIPFFTPLYVRVSKLAFIHEVAKNVWLLNPWPKPFNLIPAVLGPMFEPFIFKWIYRNVLFMAVSKSTAEDLAAWGISSENIHVIHNGVNLVKVDNNKKEEKFTVTYLGALSRDKGIEYALEVFSYLEKIRSGKFNFWVIGGGEEKYLKLLIDKGKEVNLKYWGYVDEKAKFELLARSDVLLNTSVREGWGLVVIEAASVGVPTVGFEVQGIRDSVINGKTGLLSTPLDVKQIAGNVLRLMDDKKLYKKLHKNSIERSKQFSWGRSTRDSLVLIKSIVGTHD